MDERTAGSDAHYARLTGIVGRGLKASGRRPTAADMAIHDPLPGEPDREASVLGQIAVDGFDVAALGRARKATLQVVDAWRDIQAETDPEDDASCFDLAFDHLGHAEACLEDLDRYMDDPLSHLAPTCETLSEFELVDID